MVPSSINFIFFKDVFMDSIFSSLGPMVLLGPAPQGEGGGGMLTFLPLVAIIAIFYFLILRPQKKRQQETQKMLSELRKGDRIVTIGGIHGIIQSVRESTVIVKVDESVKLEFNRAAISNVVSHSHREDRTEEASGDEDKN